MLTTVWTFSGARPPRNSVFLRRLCALLALDERRPRPPITLPGRSAVICELSPPPRPPRPPRPPVAGAPLGPWSVRRPGKLNRAEAEPEDVFGPYTRAQLVRMDRRFTRRVERAFRRGAERRDAARATYRAGHV